MFGLMNIGSSGNYQQVMSLNGGKLPSIKDYDPTMPEYWGDQVTSAAIELNATHVLREDRRAVPMSTNKPPATVKVEESSHSEIKVKEERDYGFGYDQSSPTTPISESSSGMTAIKAKAQQARKTIIGQRRHSFSAGSKSPDYSVLKSKLFVDMTDPQSTVPGQVRISSDTIDIIDPEFPDATYSQRHRDWLKRLSSLMLLAIPNRDRIDTCDSSYGS